MTRRVELESRGDDVAYLQERLNSEALPGVPLLVDGYLGPVTDGVVRSYQDAHGLVVDGVVGPVTWSALLGRTVVETPGLFVLGRHLYDRVGARVLLRGVNKMSVFDLEDPRGELCFREIRKTGANTVRIVWAITQNLRPGGPATDLSRLGPLIANARAHRLIPMIELHDATGSWERLGELAGYWSRTDVREQLTGHFPYLLLNIGNEVGNDQVTAAMFRDGYQAAVTTLRGAGITTPLVIDAPDWGKNLDVLNAAAADLLAADPHGNLVFSTHAYWSLSCGDTADQVRSRLDAAAGRGYPLVVGEFSAYGGYPCSAPGSSICSEHGRVAYQAVLEACDRNQIGWYAWEWGPGNGYDDPTCTVMDMTPTRLFDDLQPGWATEVATTSAFGIAHTARTPPSMS